MTRRGIIAGLISFLGAKFAFARSTPDDGLTDEQMMDLLLKNFEEEKGSLIISEARDAFPISIKTARALPTTNKLQKHKNGLLYTSNSPNLQFFFLFDQLETIFIYGKDDINGNDTCSVLPQSIYKRKENGLWKKLKQHNEFLVNQL